MADTYKKFTSDDIIVGDTAVVSSPVWSGDVNPLTTFFTASNSSSWEYHVPIYDKDPNTDSTAAIQFSIAYGDYNGYGSLGSSTIVDSTSNTPSKVVYSQFVATLLEPTVQSFTINNNSATNCFFFTINRARFKQKLDPGNWELWISGSVGLKKFIDGSGAGEDPTINSSGRVFNIYSGSGAVTASNTVYGLAYPDLGVLVFTASIAGLAGIPFNNASSTAAKNAASMSLGVKLGQNFEARTEEKITSNYYFARITNKQFNFSTNPTFVTGSHGQFKWSVMEKNPQVYITTVGLYDDANQHLATAKLSKPFLKNFNREALIKIKIDY